MSPRRGRAVGAGWNRWLLTDDASPVRWLALGLAFVLEMVAWVTLGVAASTTVDGTAARIAVGVVAFALVTTGWGLLAAPRAPVRHPATRAATTALVLLGAAAALAVLVHPAAGVAFAMLAVIDQVALHRMSG